MYAGKVIITTSTITSTVGIQGAMRVAGPRVKADDRITEDRWRGYRDIDRRELPPEWVKHTGGATIRCVHTHPTRDLLCVSMQRPRGDEG